MARPRTIGLRQFQVTVDCMSSDALVAAKTTYGPKSAGVWLALMCVIYTNGYYVQWSQTLRNQVADLSGTSAGYVEQVTRLLVAYGHFDRTLFDSDTILTSSTIQGSYAAAKRNKGLEGLPYWIINAAETRVIAAKTRVIAAKTRVIAAKTRVIAAETPVIAAETPIIAAKTPLARGTRRDNNNIIINNDIDIARECEALKADELWLDELQVPTGRSRKELQECVDLFGVHCRTYAQLEQHRDMADAKRHFIDWLRKQPNANQNHESRSTHQPNPKRRAAGAAAPGCGLIEN